MKIAYIGTSRLVIPGYPNYIENGTVIEDPELVEGLKKRPDFQVVKDEVETTPKKKGRRKLNG